MGVTGLWTVVQPCARPIKIDTLNKKRLAVDASIWIYQFLKAVRDKEGNALRNSHVVGFFRRICKLLFYGIKPVFVFDGGAPALKRQTISGRKARREGRREDAVRTAGKLLALQMQRRAEEDEQRRQDETSRPAHQVEEEEVPENPVYVDELQMTEQERNQGRKFKKKDQYHLPALDVPLAEMGGPNDPRVMSFEELESYARQFESGEDINVYDFSKIDFNSPFFTSLPATDRYNILNAARLRSRLRMGYSKDQLESMFPDRMAFSRFQIERVRERNELTQRLMQVGTVDDGTFGLDDLGRVSGEKGREYVLVKNAGVEGGWALGVIGNKDKDEGNRNKPIDLDEVERRTKEQTNDGEDGSLHMSGELSTDEILKRRRAFYDARKKTTQGVTESDKDTAPASDNDDALFVADDVPRPAQMANDGDGSSDESSDDDEEAQLQLAIAMSLRSPNDIARLEQNSKKHTMRPPLPPQRKALESNPFKGERGSVASIANREARRTAPTIKASAEVSFPDPVVDSDEEDTFEGALAGPAPSKQAPAANTGLLPKQHLPPKQAQFDGPLPFEKLDLGSSLLGKKKMKKLEEENEGGFEKDTQSRDQPRPSGTVPPWFSLDPESGLRAQRADDEEDRRKVKKAEEDARFQFQGIADLRQQKSFEIIDLERLESDQQEPINIESSDEESIEVDKDGQLEWLVHPPELEEPDEEDDDIDEKDQEHRPLYVQDSELRMGDLADKLRAEPQESALVAESQEQTTSQALFPKPKTPPRATSSHSQSTPAEPTPLPDASISLEDNTTVDDEVEWKVSDYESNAKQQQPERPVPASPSESESSSRSDSPDVFMPDSAAMASITAQHEADARKATTESHDAENNDAVTGDESVLVEGDEGAELPMSGAADQNGPLDEEDPQMFSDDEDEELMVQLATEAEEHARFTSTLNHKTQRQNMEEYERELKALRTQQKKDRRDADEVTHVMISECQQLLKLFGLPYITAPMEAEAQCAELVSLGLVDGIVTDDSDCFLFGGTRVYKNMFNAAKFVECYLTSDLERDFDLTRQKMIDIAYLLGSDYTEGLPGVGPVTALEIITEFPDGLATFREWWSAVQMGAPASEADKVSAFRRKFRKNASKLFLPPAFPDPRVQLAYLSPEVDKDASTFQWGVPDLDALRTFLMATIGWSQERTDEVLVPVVRDMNRRENEGTQANITGFLGSAAGGAGPTVGAGAFAPRVRAEGKSRRMESALERMAEEARRKRKGGGARTLVEGSSLTSTAKGGESTASVDGRIPRRKQARPRHGQQGDEDAEATASDASASEPSSKKRKTAPRGKRGPKAKARTKAKV